MALLTRMAGTVISKVAREHDMVSHPNLLAVDNYQTALEYTKQGAARRIFLA